MSDIKTKYPATSTVALTLSLASLADDNANMLAGRASTAVDNSSNLDLDHLVSGYVTLGSSPTASRYVEVWAYAAVSIASGTPTYPDSITGSDANKTMTSANVKYGALVQLDTLVTDATTGRVLTMKKKSIAQAFGGSLPQFWGLFIVQGSGVALNSTGGNHVWHYERVQQQAV